MKDFLQIILSLLGIAAVALYSFWMRPTLEIWVYLGFGAIFLAAYAFQGAKSLFTRNKPQ